MAQGRLRTLAMNAREFFPFRTRAGGIPADERYEYGESTAEGGWYECVSGFDRLRKEPVCIKTFRCGEGLPLEARLRFLMEMNALAGSPHVSLERVIEVSEKGDGTVIRLITGPLAGVSLVEMRAGGGLTLPVGAVIDIGLAVCGALCHLHGNGMPHGDIRPDNIFATDPARHDAGVVLGGAGLWRLRQPYGRRGDAPAVSELLYLAPECFPVPGVPVDERADLYSLGLVLYVLFTGTYPYRSTTPWELMHGHLAVCPDPPSSFNAMLDSATDKLVLALLEKDPARRPASSGETLSILAGLKGIELPKGARVVSRGTGVAFVGRSAELERLERALAGTAAGRGCVCVISGNPGVGKTRLLNEFGARAARDGWCVLTAECRESGRTPFGPIIDLLVSYERRFALYRRDDRERVRGHISRICGFEARSLAGHVPGFAPVLGELPERRTVRPDIDSEARRSLTCVFHALAEAEGGLLLCVDNLHRADVDTLSALREMLRLIGNSALMLAATTRSDADEWPRELGPTLSRERVSIVELGGLDPDDTAEFVALALGASRSEVEEAGRAVFERSGGNPLIAGELVARMRDTGILGEERNSLVFDRRRFQAMELPGSVAEAVASRVARLSSGERSVLDWASVMGREFDVTLLLRVMGSVKSGADAGYGPATRLPGLNRAALDVLGRIDRAMDAGVLERDLEATGRVRFSHDRIREILYGDISPQLRRRMHRTVALAIEEERWRGRVVNVFDLAHHFAEAGDRVKSFLYCLPAADLARSRAAHREAERYLSICLRILEEGGCVMRGTDLARLFRECSVKRAGSLLFLGRNDEAAELFRGLLETATEPEDAAFLHRQLMQALYRSGELDEAREHAETGLGLLGERLPRTGPAVAAGIVRELARFLAGLALPARRPEANSSEYTKYDLIFWYFHWHGWINVCYGGIRLTYIALRMAVIALKHLGRSRQLAESYSFVFMAFAFLGFPEMGRRYIRKTHTEDFAPGDLYVRAHHEFQRGFYFLLRGEPRAAREGFAGSLDIFRRLGDRWEFLKPLNQSCFVDFLLGEFDSCERLYREALNWEGTAFEDVMLHGWGFTALVFIARSEYEKAEEMLLRHYHDLVEKNLSFPLFLNAMWRGWLGLEKGDSAAALELLRFALSLERTRVIPPMFGHGVHVFLAEAAFAGLDNAATRDEGEIKGLLRECGDLCRAAVRKSRRWRYFHGRALRTMARYLARTGDTRGALRYCRKAEETDRALNRPYELALTLAELSALLVRTNRFAEALEKSVEADALFKRLGVRRNEDRERPVNPGESPGASQERYRALAGIVCELSDLDDEGEVYRMTLDRSMRLVGAQRGALFTADETGELCPAALVNIEGKVPDSMTAAMARVHTENGSLIATYPACQAAEGPGGEPAPLSVLCVAATGARGAHAVCYLDNCMVSRAFSESDAEIVRTLVAQSLLAARALGRGAGQREPARSEEPDKNPAAGEKIDSVRRYIEAHYTNYMSRETLATVSGLNPDYLCRQFKLRAGKTPMEYLCEVRVREAARRLARGDARVIDVALDVGFESLRTFNREFRRIMGHSPRRHRGMAGVE
ncbi:MAG TPA: AAA family ATPase [Spirochaetota bacterium]|nr:AAA family ATPase [Spirochaetota bacterium]